MPLDGDARLYDPKPAPKGVNLFDIFKMTSAFCIGIPIAYNGLLFLFDGFAAGHPDYVIVSALLFATCCIPFHVIRTCVDPAYKQRYLDYIASFPPGDNC